MNARGERTPDGTNDLTSTEHSTKEKARVTVAEAATRLGLSAEAVRMRIKRGTLASEKVGGTVYVLFAPDRARQGEDQTNDPTAGLTDDQTDLVEALRSEVVFLREELQRREEVHVEDSRRKDSIIMALTQRVPELEAPSEATGASETASEGSGGGPIHQTPQEPPETRPERSWWRRFFGFE